MSIAKRFFFSSLLPPRFVQGKRQKNELKRANWTSHGKIPRFLACPKQQRTFPKRNLRVLTSSPPLPPAGLTLAVWECHGRTLALGRASLRFYTGQRGRRGELGTLCTHKGSFPGQGGRERLLGAHPAISLLCSPWELRGRWVHPIPAPMAPSPPRRSWGSLPHQHSVQLGQDQAVLTHPQMQSPDLSLPDSPQPRPLCNPIATTFLLFSFA